MNRKSLKILMPLTAISFIIQIVLLGYAFAYDTSVVTEEQSKDHNLSGNYKEGHDGLDYYNSAMYYPGDFNYDYYESDASGGNQDGSDGYTWGDYDYGGYADGWGYEDFGWDDLYYDDPGAGNQSVYTDSYVYNWGDYDSFIPVEDGVAGGGTYDPAPDAFSQPLDKSQFVLSAAENSASGIGISINDTMGIGDDTGSLGDSQKILEVANNALPDIGQGSIGLGKPETAQQILQDLGLGYD